VAPEDERHLATVVEVVLDQVPDHPLSGERLRARAALAGELDGEVVRRPTLEALIDHRPGQVERLDDLLRPPRMVLIVLPPRVLERQVGNRRAVTRNMSRVAGSPSPRTSWNQ